MGWPLGKKRTGHVNKDGSKHAKRGSKFKTPAGRGRATSARQRVQGDQVTQTPTQRAPEEEAAFDKAWEVKPEWKSLLRWSGNRPAWTTFCPACTFPEADGAFCPACGWSAPIVYNNG